MFCAQDKHKVSDIFHTVFYNFAFKELHYCIVMYIVRLTLSHIAGETMYQRDLQKCFQ